MARKRSGGLQLAELRSLSKKLQQLQQRPCRVLGREGHTRIHYRYANAGAQHPDRADVAAANRQRDEGSHTGASGEPGQVRTGARRTRSTAIRREMSFILIDYWRCIRDTHIEIEDHRSMEHKIYSALHGAHCPFSVCCHNLPYTPSRIHSGTKYLRDMVSGCSYIKISPYFYHLDLPA